MLSYSRSAAWDSLSENEPYDSQHNPWRKCHTENYWVWVKNQLLSEESEMSKKTLEQKRVRVAKFGNVLNFNFVQNLENPEWIYPSIVMDGPEGTSAELFGQSMTPQEIEELGLSLVKYAASLRQSALWADAEKTS